MKAVQVQNGFFLVLERGEELIGTLKGFCRENEVHWGQFSGIGALEDVEIGYYDLPSRQYVFRKEEGPFEVANMDGNVTELDEEPLIHTHAALAHCDDSLSTIGGHVRSAIVALTLEICMWQISQPLLRGYDEETGLNLIQL